MDEHVMPTKRGGGGRLRLLWWQAPTLLNPHLSFGLTNSDGLRIFYEPPASFDPDGNPVLRQNLVRLAREHLEIHRARRRAWLEVGRPGSSDRWACGRWPQRR